MLISDIPENIEVMGECAPRFQSRNVDDLEARLRDLLAHPATVEHYMEMTREQISRRFSWETIVAELETCYFEMASGRSTGAGSLVGETPEAPSDAPAARPLAAPGVRN